MKIDIGCKKSAHEGFSSVDLFVEEADIKDDIRTLSTFADESVEEVVSTHILEHLADKDVLPAMRSVHRVLKKGGKWTIEVPDLIWVLDNFVHEPEETKWGWKLQTVFGLQSHEGEFHKTGFSQERLRSMLLQSGFYDVRVRAYYAEAYSQQVIEAIAIK